MGEDCVTMAGKPTILERAGDLSFEISPTSFYQINPVQMIKLYDKALEYAGLTGSETVLDLYCGVGAIGLYCASKAKKVIGIESVKSAVIDANRNAVINGIVNAKFICGKAEEAINDYTAVFPNSHIDDISRYGKDQALDREGTIVHAAFTLDGQPFAAMDRALAHNFSFNEATSFVVNCTTQEEIDYYWDKLSADPNVEQCGWLKDKYGLSWQIVPVVLQEMLQDPDPQKVARVTQAFMPMKKIDIATLQRACRG
jgi:predicted 3-demethylubiquinone-9 3-methyltransferase (glyoxalase superfamily)